MSVNCKDPKELAEAIKNNEDTIYIEGDLKKAVIRIKATGKIAWGVCFAALATAIVAILATPGLAVTTGGVGGAMSFAGSVSMSAVAAATLGSAVAPAIAIGIAAGGAGVLNLLRDKYKIVDKNDKFIELKRK